MQLTIALGRSRKSTVPPVLSTARYKYFQRPLTFTYVSSIRQRSQPDACGREIADPTTARNDHPAIERGMVDFDAALFHHFSSWR